MTINEVVSENSNSIATVTGTSGIVIMLGDWHFWFGLITIAISITTLGVNWFYKHQHYKKTQKKGE